GTPVAVDPPPAPAPAPAPPGDNAEVAYWNSIAFSTNRADFESYLRDYPNGTFVGLARNRLAALNPAPSVGTSETRASLMPSFNCGVVSLPAELAICADAELSELDNRLARKFSALMAASPAAAASATRAEQGRWLQLRNGCGSDRECLAGRYRARLDELAE